MRVRNARDRPKRLTRRERITNFDVALEVAASFGVELSLELDPIDPRTASTQLDREPVRTRERLFVPKIASALTMKEAVLPARSDGRAEVRLAQPL